MAKVTEQTPQQWEESVSVLMDSEPTAFDPLNLDMPYGRQVWEQYHLIGDVMRDRQLALRPSDLFYARLSKALEQEPCHRPPKRRRWPLAALTGLALAAGLVVALVLPPRWLFNAQTSPTDLTMALRLPVESANGVAPPMPHTPAVVLLGEPRHQAEQTPPEVAPSLAPAMSASLGQVRPNSTSATDAAKTAQAAEPVLNADEPLPAPPLAIVASTTTAADASRGLNTAAQWQQNFQRLIHLHQRHVGLGSSTPLVDTVSYTP